MKHFHTQAFKGTTYQVNLANVWAHALNLCTNCLILPLKHEANRACGNDMRQGQGFIFFLFWSSKRLPFPWSLPHYPPSLRTGVESSVKNTSLTSIQSQMVIESDKLSNVYGHTVCASICITEIIIEQIWWCTLNASWVMMYTQCILGDAVFNLDLVLFF